MKHWHCFLLILAIFTLDCLTKFYIQHHLPLYGRIQLTSFFNLTHLYNTGVIFGWFNHAAGWMRICFFILAGFSGALLTILLIFYPQQRAVTRLGYSLVLGGAIGNLVDRILHNAVTDFLDFHIGQYHWPSFNVADMAIVLGIACVLSERQRY